MRLLIASDIHQEEESIERMKMKEGYDHLLVCGDISRNVSFAEEVLEAFPDAFIVPGNWDSEAVNKVISKAKNFAHKKRFELNELNIVGFGYSNITPFDTFGELTEEEIYSQMSGLDIDQNTILLLHCPPKEYFDEVGGEHVGSESILKIIQEKKPFAAFFGHVHDHSGTRKLDTGNCTLVKVPSASGMRACVAQINCKEMKIEYVIL